MLTALAAAALFAGFVASTPLRIRSPHVVKETHLPPNKWKNVGPAPADHVINLQIGLKQSQFDELERHLHEGEHSPY
jgi:tripeptidyl-peptidase-1